MGNEDSNKMNWNYIGYVKGFTNILVMCSMCSIYVYIYICVGDSFKVNWNYVGFLWVTPISW